MRQILSFCLLTEDLSTPPESESEDEVRRSGRSRRQTGKAADAITRQAKKGGKEKEKRKRRRDKGAKERMKEDNQLLVHGPPRTPRVMIFGAALWAPACVTISRSS